MKTKRFLVVYKFNGVINTIIVDAANVNEGWTAGRIWVSANVNVYASIESVVKA